MVCPNCKKVVPDDSERCSECGIEFKNYQSSNSAEKARKSNFIVIFKRILLAILILTAYISAISSYAPLAIASILLAVFVWVALTIEEKKIDLLQEISEKLDKNN